MHYKTLPGSERCWEEVLLQSAGRAVVEQTESSERVCGLVCVVFMVAGRSARKDGRKPSALEELFGSDSEASTFYGFEDNEAEDVWFSEADEDP